jgi:hypothetical protein
VTFTLFSGFLLTSGQQSEEQNHMRNSLKHVLLYYCSPELNFAQRNALASELRVWVFRWVEVKVIPGLTVFQSAIVPSQRPFNYTCCLRRNVRRHTRHRWVWWEERQQRKWNYVSKREKCVNIEMPQRYSAEFGGWEDSRLRGGESASLFRRLPGFALSSF